MDKGVQSQSSFVKRVFSVFATKGLMFLFGMVASMVSARILGPEGRGVFGTAAVLGGIGSQFMNLGMHASSNYILAKDQGKKDSVWGNSLVVSLVSGVIAAGIYCVLNYFPLMPLSGGTLLLACASIPVLLYSMLQQNLFIGLHQVKFYNLMEILISVLFPAFLVVCFAFGTVTPELAYSFSIAAHAATCLLGAFLFRFRLGAKPRPDRKVFVEALPFGIKSYVASLLSYLVIRSDILIVSHMLGNGPTGLYTTAVSLADIIGMLPSALGLLLFPEAASMTSDIQRHKFMKKTLIVFSALMGGVTAIAALLAKYAIRILYGDSFMLSSEIFMILMPGIFFMALSSILSNYFAARNMWSGNIATPLVGLLINIPLDLMLVPVYGVRGAAIASVIAYFAMFSFMLIRFLRDSKRVIKSEY